MVFNRSIFCILCIMLFSLENLFSFQQHRHYLQCWTCDTTVTATTSTFNRKQHSHWASSTFNRLEHIHWASSTSNDLKDDYKQRFNNVARLYPDAVDRTLNKLNNARVLVVGLGGVGSWVVEALARSGIGHFTLIDMDDICVSNTNRQIHAMTSTVGQFKAGLIYSSTTQLITHYVTLT